MDNLNPPAHVRTADRSIADLKKAIKDKHLDAENHAYEAMQYFREVGQMLEEVKRKLPDGDFMEWVDENCEFSYRQGSNYRRLAREWDKIQSGTAVPLGSLKAAMRVLSEEDEEEEQPEDQPASDPEKPSEPILCTRCTNLFKAQGGRPNCLDCKALRDSMKPKKAAKAPQTTAATPAPEVSPLAHVETPKEPPTKKKFTNAIDLAIKLIEEMAQNLKRDEDEEFKALRRAAKELRTDFIKWLAKSVQEGLFI